MGAHVAIPPVVLGAHVVALSRRTDVELPAPRVYFRSRAPPTLL
jgi:hypothetical protein